MTQPVAPVSVDTVSDILETHKVYSSLHEKITNRMDYIIRHCVELAGGKFDWWDWLNDGDYEDRSSGDFMQSYGRESIGIRAAWSNREIIFIDKNGGEWGLEDGIPTRWLYEDFEEEFANGLKLYADKQKQKAQQAKLTKLQREAQKKELIKSAAAKLSKEERKALGIKQ